ncbi:hypothetical protein D3C78_879580 [compost metagenome]
MPAQRFHGVGQAIKGMGGQQQTVEQQGIGRDRGVAQPRALHRDQKKHRLQRQAADEDVAVDRQQWPPTLPQRQCRPDDMPGIGTQGLAGHQQADQRPRPFGNHRGPGGTDHAPFEAKDEPQVQGDIDQVGTQQNRQRRPGILGAEKPADQCITGQRGGQSEQAGVEKLAGQLIELRRRLHEVQRRCAQRHAHSTQDQGQAEGEQQALQQNLPQGRTIPAPGRLGGEPGGAHAQKTHGPGKEGIQTGPDRDGAELMGVGQVTDDGAVDQCHQRYGNVRKNHRRGECPDPAMGRAVAPVGGQVGHAGSLGERAL